MAFTSAKTLLARASGTSAAISSTPISRPPAYSASFSISTAMRAISRAQRFHQQLERPGIDAKAGRAAPALRPPRGPRGRQSGAVPPRRERPHRICARDPACACRRPRNRSARLRTPGSRPAWGLFRYAASGAESPAVLSPRRSAASCSAFRTQIRRSEANSESDRASSSTSASETSARSCCVTAPAGKQAASPSLMRRRSYASGPSSRTAAGRAPFLHARQKLRGRHVRNAPGSRSPRTVATSRLTRLMAVPLSSKYCCGSMETS